jgi:transposase
MWIDVTPKVTVFRVMRGRSQAEAREMLGKGVSGIVNTDRYAAYHWLDGHRRQLCWAHLKREFEAIKQRGGTSAEIGAGLLEEVRDLFDLWRQLRAGSLSREQFQQQMEPIQARVRELGERGASCEQTKTRQTCANLLNHEVSLWTFVRDAGNLKIEPYQAPQFSVWDLEKWASHLKLFKKAYISHSSYFIAAHLPPTA